MSRLDSFIRRLEAQRACLDRAAELIRDIDGHVLELGLGNGRTYDHLRGLFPEFGIHPALKRAGGTSLTYLIPFENLTARDRAWTALTSHRAWTGTHFDSYHFSLYAVA